MERRGFDIGSISHGVHALSGIPLAQNKGWRKQELSLIDCVPARHDVAVVSIEFRRGVGAVGRDCFVRVRFAVRLAHVDVHLRLFRYFKDDKRSVLLVWLGVLLFSLQLVPTALAIQHGDLLNLREGLPQMWELSVRIDLVVELVHVWGSLKAECG